MSEKIYALMVTGKDMSHLKLSLNSVKSFLNQTYDNKELVIVNDGDYSIKDHVDDDRINEIKLDNRLSLGQLRNVSIDAVPNDSLWVQWDDDDWHHERFIEDNFNMMKKHNAKMATILSQVRYSFKINNAWVHNGADDGIEGTIMVYNDKSIRYYNLSKGEDTFFLDDYVKKYGNQFIVIDNPPHQYLRFIHGSNTWEEEHFDLDSRVNDQWVLPQDSIDYLTSILPNYKFLINQ